VRNKFNNLECVRSFPGPVLIRHGERDDCIPCAQGRQLAAAAPSAELQVLPCGHNDCPAAWEGILKFLDERHLR
jgi:pimeloyl-ACP methyl ester carboxylesterase